MLPTFTARKRSTWPWFVGPLVILPIMSAFSIATDTILPFGRFKDSLLANQVSVSRF